MIIVKLMGGLGNQMFQYAAARRLAHHHNTPLKLDLSFLENEKVTTPRVFELKHLKIEADIATIYEIDAIKKSFKSNSLQSFMSALRKPFGVVLPQFNIYKERYFQFDSMLLCAPDNTYLDGYWQSESYFKDIEDILLKEFCVTSEQTELNRLMADKIMETESISIHVRRGDYVSDEITREFHGICSLDYYRTAIDIIASHVSSPHFYVFSDDLVWVKENLKVNYPLIFMDSNGQDRGYEDLRLMGQCRHHIIANSSFSWWGAWLCRNPTKIVIAPQKWFKKKELDTRDLLPESWIKLDQ